VISPAVSSVKTAKVLYKKLDVLEDQQQYVRLAQEVSGNDLQFLYLLESENALFTPTRKHKTIGANGYYDYGFCGTNAGHQSKIFNDARFFTDPKWQLEQCYAMFKGGTTFYGYKRLSWDWEFRNKVYSHFVKI
jgi:hypothetical protein